MTHAAADAAPPRIDDLAALEAACWQAMREAVRGRGHDWRTGVLATAALDPADGADARQVVLREVDEDTRQVFVYTDARSAKVAQIARVPAGTLVLWSPRLGWQLRLKLALQLHDGGLAVASRWARVKLTRAAQDYLSPSPPGAPLDGGAATAAPAPERGTLGHFAVVQARVLALDWLELHPQGHRRATFDADGRRWRVP